MNFEPLYKIFLTGFVFTLLSCSDPDNETNLVNLNAMASLDLVSIDFPEHTETTVSVNSVADFSIEGIKSNGVDKITITDDIDWSLSVGAASSIDQQGRLSAAVNDELITLTATFGYLSASKEIQVSSAKFDRVVRLELQDTENSVINMCQSKTIQPFAHYEGEVEDRTVDSNTIKTIEWTATNEEGITSEAQRAYIEKLDSQATLHTRAAGNIVIHAAAYSQVTEENLTEDFTQAISSADSVDDHGIKICLSSDTNLSSCGVSSVNVEQDAVISLMAVGKYKYADGTDFYENISRNSQWGISNPDNASIEFSSDRQQLDVTGAIEEYRATVYAACGNIDQTIVDITQGVILDSELSCVNSSETECLDTSVIVNIDKLSVLSFEVSANDIALTDNVSQLLESKPDEISLIVNANLSNDTQRDITQDDTLDFFIIDPVDQPAVIEQTSINWVFTVIGSGTAKIQLVYRGEEFIAVIEVP